MKKEKLTQSFSVIVIIVSSAFLLLTETCQANSKRPYTRINSENQITRIPETAYKQVKRGTANPSSFKPNMSFDEAIEILRNSTVPRLNIVVLWKDLQENADIYRETPIGTDGLTRVPLRIHLKVLLMSVSGGAVEKLGYVVDEGVIIIATRGSLPKKNITRIYDITDLVSPPANYRIMPGFGMPFGFGGMNFGGAGFAGQGSYSSPNGGAYGGFNGARASR
ncbi:MAG: hypothetical protein RQ760_12185 [Sedimentisphaerales bacterium]|nr:hypothetical protein [Sedimentisphaerales bacterium]